jgi:pilus assembly protein CpaB
MKNKVVLIVAVLFGLLAAFLTRTYLSTKTDEFKKLTDRFNATHGTIDALCFKKDVPGGATLSREVIGKLTVPAAGLRGQAISEEDFSKVEGRKILLGHRTGDILFWSDIEGGNPVSGGLAGDIRRKMRAISINVSGAAAVSGMVKPNDHVDVIGTFSFPKPAPDGKTVIQELVTCTILQNVLVLATGKETAKSAIARGDAFGAGTYSMVTLEVTPREAEMLVFAEQIKGRISLALRNRHDTYYEKELPQVDYAKIREEIETLNQKRQNELNGGR